jgi:trimethylamine:corrinoid methyltransferase-like protein
MPLNNHLEVISSEHFDAIHQASMAVLEKTGIRFHCEAARRLKPVPGPLPGRLATNPAAKR